WIRDVRRTPGHVIALRRLKTAREHLERKASLPLPERQAMAARADKLKQLLSQWSKASLATTASLPDAKAAALAPTSAVNAKAPPRQTARRAFWKAFNAWEADVMS